MLLFIPSIVVNAVLIAVAIYAMWTRAADLRPGTVSRSATAARQATRREALAA